MSLYCRFVQHKVKTLNDCIPHYVVLRYFCNIQVDGNKANKIYTQSSDKIGSSQSDLVGKGP